MNVYKDVGTGSFAEKIFMKNTEISKMFISIWQTYMSKLYSVQNDIEEYVKTRKMIITYYKLT